MKVILADGVTTVEATIVGDNYNEVGVDSVENSYVVITLPDDTEETVDSLRAKFTPANLSSIKAVNKDNVTFTRNNLTLSGIFDTLTDEGRNISIRLEY